MNIQDIVDKLFDSEKQHISDGYHTFEELYEHRCRLFISLVNVLYCAVVTDDFKGLIFKARKHNDGSSYDDWFLCCIQYENGEQISYHLPDKYWDNVACNGYDIAPVIFDGHTSNDVLKRLEKWFW